LSDEFVAYARDDDDLAAIRDDPRVQELVSQA
jgi:hypothetical protein